jgi:hypothetical protein
MLKIKTCRNYSKHCMLLINYIFVLIGRYTKTQTTIFNLKTSIQSYDKYSFLNSSFILLFYSLLFINLFHFLFSFYFFIIFFYYYFFFALVNVKFTFAIAEICSHKVQILN